METTKRLQEAHRRRKELIELKLLEKAELDKKLSPSTVGLINKAKWLLILFILAKVSYAIIRQFLHRVDQSKLHK
jgi:hypothetical protein